jgi:hypothetical protein
MDDEFDTLEDCVDRIRSLKEENSELRASATAFGDLAERLRAALEQERRHAAPDRRDIRDGDRPQHAPNVDRAPDKPGNRDPKADG